jgi:hypothetical protein
MVAGQGIIDGVVRTFGPFLIPAVVFVAGVAGYTALLLLTRYLQDEETDAVVNLSAGDPDESTTAKDHGATSRGISPEDVREDGEESGDPTD